MIVLNKLHHSDEQWAALEKEPDVGTIFMINLFKFHEYAEYADGRETNLTGIEAYQICGRKLPSKSLILAGASYTQA